MTHGECSRCAAARLALGTTVKDSSCGFRVADEPVRTLEADFALPDCLNVSNKRKANGRVPITLGQYVDADRTL